MDVRMYSVRDVRGVESPPINESQLYAYVRSGHVLPATLIKDLQSGQWFAAGENPSLAVIFRQRGVNPTVPKYPPPPPPTPVAPPSTPAPVSNPLLDECARQYRAANNWIMYGVLFLGGLFGILMIVYGLAQKNNIRCKVADSGVDAQSWAAPMDRQVTVFVGILFLCFFGCVAAWFAFGIIAAALTPSVTPAPAPTDMPPPPVHIQQIGYVKGDITA